MQDENMCKMLAGCRDGHGRPPVPVTAVWLHAIFNEHGEATDSIRVCVEIDGHWHECITANASGHVSYICEESGIRQAERVVVPGVKERANV